MVSRASLGPGRGRERLRSAAWIAVVIICVLLPYRWLWVPCALAGTVLAVPSALTTARILKRDATLIAGTTVVLLLQTLLDPAWWIPWVAFLGLVCWVRLRVIAPRWRSGAAVAVVWLAALVSLERPWEAQLHTRPQTPADPGAVLVCAGDSLTAGLGLSDADTYVARLRERLGCSVINAGVANDRVADLLARVEKDVIARKPTAVLVFIGGNDYLDGTPRGKFAHELGALVGRIANCGARILIVEVPTGIVWNPYAGIYRQVAARHGAELVPESLLRLWFTWELLARDRLEKPMTLDGIHLSPDGATRVADWLEPYVRRLISPR